MTSESVTWISRELRARFIPRQRVGKQLAGIAFIDAIGTGMYYTGSALYFTSVVGLTPSQVGAGLSIGAIAGLLGAVPIGMIADRFRVGQVYIWLLVLRGLSFAAYCLVGSFPMFALVSVFAGITEASVAPVWQAVVGATVPGEERVDTLAKARALRNAGFGLGALVATIAIGQGSAGAYLTLVAGNAASFFVIAILLAIIGIASVTTRDDAVRRPSLRFVPDGRYLRTAGLSGILAVHSTLLVVALPIWFVRHTIAPAVMVGVMMTVNTILAALLQARFARPCKDVHGASRGAIWTGLALAGCALACLGAHLTQIVPVAIVLALVAVTALTFGEMWQSAIAWTLSYDLADPDRRAAYLSTFQLGVSLQAIAAPWLITAFVLPTAAGWLVFGAIIAVAGLLVGPALRERPRVSLAHDD